MVDPTPVPLIRELARELLAASPLTLALLAIIIVLVTGLIVVYKIIPSLITRREKARRGWDEQHVGDEEIWARRVRVELIAKKVHDLAGLPGSVEILLGKVKELEQDMGRRRAESGDMRVKIAELTGAVKEVSSKTDDIGDRIDREAAAMSGRMSGLEGAIESVRQTLFDFLTNSRHD